MCECNQGVGFTTTKLCVQPKDGADLFRAAKHTERDQFEDILQPLGRIGIGEEERRKLVFVRRIPLEHLREVGGKIALSQGPFENVSTRLTNGEQIVGHVGLLCIGLEKCIRKMYHDTFENEANVFRAARAHTLPAKRWLSSRLQPSYA